MPEKRKFAAFLRLITIRFRNKAAKSLGVNLERKEELYLDLSRAATLQDAVYWLQILFAAGIATLGLVLNSPAVIIGAMLISPLMSPILASGLAFATGDLVLGLRAILKLFLSCVTAITFALILVVFLPFREMTAEITARTQPNTLDLLIALFSGAVGSIAICREVKGVVTSIPGVAIAVALMPPLCVVGYGFGLGLTLDISTGWRIASGGGLLFLTNLVAITFTAMVVFLAVELSTPHVRERAEDWEHHDPESAFILNFIGRFPRLEQAREIRNLPIRFLMILVPLIAILIPLTQSFIQLKNEIAQKQKENIIRKGILEAWQEYFQNKSDGAARSTLDKLTVVEKDDKLIIDLRLFDDEPYTVAEKNQYVKLLAERLNRPVESINLNLTEIPTTSVLTALTREREKTPEIPSFTQIQANFWQEIDTAIKQINLPPTMRFLSRRLITNGSPNVLNLELTYLSEAPLSTEQQKFVIDKIRSNLNDNTISVNFNRIPANIGIIEFPRNSSTIPVAGTFELDFAGRVMHENQPLLLSVAVQKQKGEPDEITSQRLQTISNYLATRWQILPDRIIPNNIVEPTLKTFISFQTKDQQFTENVQSVP
ncbi:MAG TPA: DUF389 domain-containing protein [Pyrinomonadaceae bacterium]|nr:DUF389 domain-containing protein [Pyrinomonadaceae bacterium]